MTMMTLYRWMFAVTVAVLSTTAMASDRETRSITYEDTQARDLQVLASDDDRQHRTMIRNSSNAKNNPNQKAEGKNFAPPAIYVGYNPGEASIPLPTTKEAARDEGWEPHEEGFLKNEDLPRFFLRFAENGPFLQDILIDGPPFSEPTKEFYEKTKVDFVSIGALISFRSNDHYVVNGAIVPKHYKKAEDLGYYEGGCYAPMGGTHYYDFLSREEDFNSLSPLNPIYDSFGTGELKTILVTFGALPPSNRQGFDSDGEAINGEFGCNLNYCSKPSCLDALSGKTFSTVHVMFYDVTKHSQWSTCQTVFGDCDYLDQSGLCSCCGTKEDPSGRRSCGSPFAE